MNKSISYQYGNRCLCVNRDNIFYSMVLDFNKEETLIHGFCSLSYGKKNNSLFDLHLKKNHIFFVNHLSPGYV